MALNTTELMRNNLVLYEGKVWRVTAVSEFVTLQGKKEWIGGSLIDGEPLSDVWLHRFGFYNNNGVWSRQPEMENLEYRVREVPGGWLLSRGFGSEWDNELKLMHNIHELQNAYLIIQGASLPIPKLPK